MEKGFRGFLVSMVVMAALFFLPIVAMGSDSIDDWMPDKNLQKIIAEKLEGNPEELTQASMESIDSLIFPKLDNNVAIDLTGLEYAINMVSLDTLQLNIKKMPVLDFNHSFSTLRIQPKLMSYINKKESGTLLLGDTSHPVTYNELDDVRNNINDWKVKNFSISVSGFNDFLELGISNDFLSNLSNFTVNSGGALYAPPLQLADFKIIDGQMINVEYRDDTFRDIFGNSFLSTQFADHLMFSIMFIDDNGVETLTHDFEWTENGIIFSELPENIDKIKVFIEYLVPNRLSTINLTRRISYNLLGIIDVKHVQGEGIVTVNYQDELGNELAPTEYLTGEIDTPFSTVKKDIIGYDFKTIIGNPSGNFTANPQVVTYIYNKTKPVPSEDDTSVNREEATVQKANKLPQTGEVKISRNLGLAILSFAMLAIAVFNGCKKRLNR